MIVISDLAIEHIKKMMSQVDGAIGFSLGLKQTGCTGWMYMPDIVTDKKSDYVCMEVKGINIFIEKKHQNEIKDTEIDFIDKGLGQKQLVFKNPKATDLCGCGESFHLEGDKDE